MKEMFFCLCLTFCAAATLLGGCTDEEEGIVNGKGTGDLTLTLKLDVPKNSIPETRGMTSGDESTLNNMKILVFKNDGGTEKYAYTAYVDKFTSSSVTVKLIRSTASEQYRLVLLANVSSLPAISANEIKADVLKKITVATTTNWPVTGNNRYIPMWGESGLQEITDNTNLGTVNLLRALAKVDVDCSAVNTSAFQLKHVYVYNSNNKAYAAPLAANVPGNSVTAPSIPSDAAKNSVLTYTAANNTYASEIYLAEAAKGSATALSTSPCLVIGGIYNNSGAETYYRVDFIKTAGSTDTYLDILRNKQYNVKITKVSGNGYDTKEKAFNARAVNMNVDITAWDASGMTDVVFDGQYTLGVGKSEINISEFASYQELPVSTSYEGGYTISSSDSWIIPYASTQTRTSSGKGVVRIFFEPNTAPEARSGVINVTAGKFKLAIPVSQAAGTIERATSTTVVLEPHSNCYLVQGARLSEERKLVMEVGYKGESDIPIGNISSVGLVWRTEKLKISGLTYSPETNRAEMTIGSYGNALIAAKDANGNILWSWHLWVPADAADPNIAAYVGLSKFCQDDRIVNIDIIKGIQKCKPRDINYHMMQALGAIRSHTKETVEQPIVHYQWGRKDPLCLYAMPPRNEEGKQNAYTLNTVATADNYPEYGYTHPLEMLRAKPNTIYNGESLWGGYSSEEEIDQALTSMEPIPSSHKTIYDPSPFGWKVPSCQGEMYSPNYKNWGLRSSSNGLTVGTDPAEGSIPRYVLMTISADEIVQGKESFYMTSMVKQSRYVSSDALDQDGKITIFNDVNKGPACLVHCVRDF